MDKDENNEIYEELEDYLSYEFTETEKVEIRNLYLFIKYGYSATDKITGIPGEAFNDATFAQLMQEATKYIGFPYQWGGSTPETSFDCSGFVCWVYTHSGVHNLSRTTAQQIYNQCTPVSKDEVKPGDLVFFTGTYQSSNPRNPYWNLCWGQSNVALRRSHRLCKLGEFLLGEAFLWIWQIVKECEKV